MEYDSQTDAQQNSGAYIFVPVGPAQALPYPISTSLILGEYLS